MTLKTCDRDKTITTLHLNTQVRTVLIPEYIEKRHTQFLTIIAKERGPLSNTPIPIPDITNTLKTYYRYYPEIQSELKMILPYLIDRMTDYGYTIHTASIHPTEDDTSITFTLDAVAPMQNTDLSHKTYCITIDLLPLHLDDMAVHWYHTSGLDLS